MADEEKKQKCVEGAPVWMCTFADLMSLLMCFFILLLSFSELDRKKFKQVAGSMEDAFGIQLMTPADDSPRGIEIISKDFPTIPMDPKRLIMEAVLEEIEDGEVTALESNAGVKLRIKDTVAFAPGRAEIQADFQKFLEKIGKVVAQLGLQVTVGGHTDNTPVRKGAAFTTNWGLSTARAVQVVEFWQKKFSIPAENLAAAGFADGNPVASNDTAAGRGKNRRVEIFIRTNKDMPAFDGIKNIVE